MPGSDNIDSLYDIIIDLDNQHAKRSTSEGIAAQGTQGPFGQGRHLFVVQPPQHLLKAYPLLQSSSTINLAF